MNSRSHFFLLNPARFLGRCAFFVLASGQDHKDRIPGCWMSAKSWHKTVSTRQPFSVTIYQAQGLQLHQSAENFLYIVHPPFVPVCQSHCCVYLRKVKLFPGLQDWHLYVLMTPILLFHQGTKGAIH